MNSALVESMRVKIGEALEAQSVDVTDMYGDGRHVSIEVVSASFEGKSSMQRQRMVYKVRSAIMWLKEIDINMLPPSLPGRLVPCESRQIPGTVNAIRAF